MKKIVFAIAAFLLIVPVSVFADYSSAMTDDDIDVTLETSIIDGNRFYRMEFVSGFPLHNFSITLNFDEYYALFRFDGSLSISQINDKIAEKVSPMSIVVDRFDDGIGFDITVLDDSKPHMLVIRVVYSASSNPYDLYAKDAGIYIPVGTSSDDTPGDPVVDEEGNITLPDGTVIDVSSLKLADSNFLLMILGAAFILIVAAVAIFIWGLRKPRRSRR